MKFRINHHSGTPIYEQMVSAVIAAIDAGELTLGDKLPSIRALAAELGINPNTVARVYRELELRGFVESRSGSGCFVRPVDEKAAAAAKRASMQELWTRMLGEAKARRIDAQDFLDFVKKRAT
jgi:GntR family transcriptional regulator